jgi:hypothetical protein
VVAIWVVDVPEVAVGAVGTPLNAGFDADNDIPLMVPPVIATKLASIRKMRSINFQIAVY